MREVPTMLEAECVPSGAWIFSEFTYLVVEGVGVIPLPKALSGSHCHTRKPAHEKYRYSIRSTELKDEYPGDHRVPWVPAPKNPICFRTIRTTVKCFGYPGCRLPDTQYSRAIKVSIPPATLLFTLLNPSLDTHYFRQSARE